MAKEVPRGERWRVGSKVGRTIYRGDGPDDLIGCMDTRAAARLAAAAPLMADALRAVWGSPKVPQTFRLQALEALRTAGIEP